MTPHLLEYAPPDPPPVRRPATVLDRLYATLVMACYLLAVYAHNTMPGGYKWSYEFARADLLMTVAAQSASVLCVAGLREVLREGPKRCAGVILFGTLAGGTLPALMFMVARRWLQNTFS